MKEIIGKLNFIKMKIFHSAKDNVNRIRTQATDWEKIFAKYTSERGLLSKIYKELLKLNNKEINNSIKRWTKPLEFVV